MDLRHLRYFIATAEELHFTRAAQRIGIAQPALTYQIQSLERELGVRLFDRRPGHVQLTEPGRVFVEEARALLERLSQAVQRCQRSALGTVGRIGVGMTESASFSPVVTSALHHYHRLYPQVEMTLEESRTVALVQSLRQGRIDVAFVRLPVGMDEEVRFELLYTEPMVVALPRRHRLARRKALRLKELRDEPFLLYPRATRFGLSDAIVTACEAQGFSPRVVQQAPQISSTVNLVASGLGLTIVPACMRSARSDEVRYVPLKDGELMASLGIAFRAAGRTPAMNNLIQLATGGVTARS